MISLVPLRKTKAGKLPRSTARASQTAIMPAVPAHTGRIHRQQPQELVSRAAPHGMRCLWYTAALTEMLAHVDEFLRTPTGNAALADFYRARRGSPAPESEVRTLIEVVGRTAARLRA